MNGWVGIAEDSKMDGYLKSADDKKAVDFIIGQHLGDLVEKLVW